MTIANLSLSDTFDTQRIRTNQVIYSLDLVDQAGQAGYAKANSGNIIATSAFNKANSANIYVYLVDANTSAAFGKANTANLYTFRVDANATAAFSQANIAIANVNYTNTAMQAAFLKANTANSYTFLVDANTTAAFSKANTANSYAYLVDANTTAAFAKANAANLLAFSANTVVTANVNYVNTAMQSAFSAANTANTIINNITTPTAFTPSFTFGTGSGTVTNQGCYYTYYNNMMFMQVRVLLNITVAASEIRMTIPGGASPGNTAQMLMGYNLNTADVLACPCDAATSTISVWKGIGSALGTSPGGSNGEVITFSGTIRVP